MCRFSVKLFKYLVVLELCALSTAEDDNFRFWSRDWSDLSKWNPFNDDFLKFDINAQQNNNNNNNQNNNNNNNDFWKFDNLDSNAQQNNNNNNNNNNDNDFWRFDNPVSNAQQNNNYNRYSTRQYDDDVNFLTNVISNLENNIPYFQLPTNARQYQPYQPYNSEDFGNYDFIVVGAGAAGSLMANRLSEVPQWKVLLIEAGDYGDNITDIPNMYYQVEFTQYNWGFQSAPQTSACQGMVNKICPLARGRGVGGTTLINGLVYARGSSIDFDRWAKEVNDYRWSYDMVLPFFKRTERFDHRDMDAPVFSPIHGTNGLTNVEHHLPRSPQLDAFLQANEELGYPVADYNAGTGLGASPAQIYTRNGRTEDTGTSFVLPALNRRNLDVMVNSYVTKILIDDNKQARGVIFSHQNRLYQATAAKEVIISGGTYQSPQLLMLSGIGPRDHLESLGIPVVQDLEVGSRFWDHACYYGLNFGTNYTEPIRPLQGYVAEFLAGNGPLAAPGNNQGVAFYESQFTRGTGYPDFEIMFIPSNATNDFTQRAFQITDQTYEDVWRYNNRSQTYVLYLIALHAQSAGTVRLRSSDPYEYPMIDPRFLSDPQDRDIRTIYEAVQLSLKLASTKALQGMDATLQGHPMRNCRQHIYPSQEYWFCAIRQMTMDIYHPVGSCGMGPDPRKGAVVDSECRVHGVGKLRVVDASVFPFPLAGHPTAGILLVGEMAADFIKQTYL